MVSACTEDMKAGVHSVFHDMMEYAAISSFKTADNFVQS